MKTALAAAVVLASLQGGVIAVPLGHDLAQDRHAANVIQNAAQQETRVGEESANDILTQRNALEDAVRQIAEETIVKRQIGGLLSNKNIMAGLVLALADEQMQNEQLSRRDVVDDDSDVNHVYKRIFGDLFFNGLRGSGDSNDFKITSEPKGSGGSSKSNDGFNGSKGSDSNSYNTPYTEN